MRKTKKIIALLLSACLVGGCLAGCGKKAGNKKVNNSTTEIEISVWNSGLGVKWLENIIEGFEKAYPKYSVRYVASASASATLATFGMEDIDTVDLYLSHRATTSNRFMEPLDDVLATTVDGESRSIKEKFIGAYLETEEHLDGHYYTLTYGGGIVSFVYNAKIFKDAGITQMPRTTKEFVALCDNLYDKGITPLCHFTSGGYYEYLLNVFTAQYEGYDYYVNNLYRNTDADGTTPSKEALIKKDGRYQALKEMEKFITPDYTMLGSNTKSHTEVQTMFINDSAAMMFNGSWLKNEMINTGNVDDLRTMRIPVVSSIIDKLTTVKSDADLRTVISAIDEVTEGSKKESDFASGDNYVIGDLTISADDWNTVFQARNMVASNYGGSDAFIPEYSNAKEGAKLFLQYMYSDEGIKTYSETIGVPLPLVMSNGEGFDYSSLTEIEQRQFELVYTAKYFVDSNIASKGRIFTDNGINIMANISYVDKMSALNKQDRVSADVIWKSFEDKVEDQYEKIWINNIK